MSWATQADVAMYTGAEVDTTMLAMAQGIIDLVSNVTEATSAKLKPRDLRLLKMACAYQAGWMPSHPDLFGRMDIKTVDQEGAGFDPAHPDALLLAPLARRWLSKLSWVRTRSVPIGHPDDRFRRTKNWTPYREAQDVRGYPELGPYGELPYEPAGDGYGGGDAGPSLDSDDTHSWEPL